jgi:hypothetical protein
MKTKHTIHISKGYEDMKFSDEFTKAIKALFIKADLSQMERKLAEDLCQNQDQRLRETLASQ